MYIIFLIFSILLAVFAQILWKSFAISNEQLDFTFLNLLDLKLILGFLLYFISAIFYISAIHKIQLSLAYPSISISYIVISILSFFLFNEALTINKFIGSLVIIIGIYLIWK